MTPALQDGPVTVYHGDALDVLREMADESVHMVLTSPPYWGLRNYNEPGQLGLEATPDEYVENMVRLFREVRRVLRSDGTCWLNLGDSYASGEVGRHDRSDSWDSEFSRPKGTGARQQRRQCTGLKPKDLVMMPARVAMALQADGWYLRSDIAWVKRSPMPESVRDRPTSAWEHIFLLAKSPHYYFDSFAVREGVTVVVEGADGLDESVVLGKNLGLGSPPATGAHTPSGFDEARRLVQNAVGYATAVLQGPELQREFGLGALDSEVREQLSEDANRVLVRGAPVMHLAAASTSGLFAAQRASKQFFEHLHSLGLALADRDVLGVGLAAAEGSGAPLVGRDRDAAIGIYHSSEVGNRQSSFVHNQESTVDGTTSTGRNMRNVWILGPEPFKAAHFAVFPSEIPLRAIKAGTSERGCCLDCGAPWRRVVGRRLENTDGWGSLRSAGATRGQARKDHHEAQGSDAIARNGQGRAGDSEVTTIGWEPTCNCVRGLPSRRKGPISASERARRSMGLEKRDLARGANVPHPPDPVPCTVLDPFAGSGTTLAVARRLGRRSIGIELSQSYIDTLIRPRISGAALPLLEWLQEDGG